MEEKVVVILNEMAEFLSVAQMKKLQEVMLKVFMENRAEKKAVDNEEYLKMFLDAKAIEGCSCRTIQFYRVTIEKINDLLRCMQRQVLNKSYRR